MSCKIVLDSLKGLPREARGLIFYRSQVRLNVLFAGAGYELRERGTVYHWDGRKRGRAPGAALQYTLSGEGHLQWEDAEYRLTPGTLMVVHYPHSHVYSLPPGAEWEFCWVSLTGPEAISAVRKAVREAGPVLQPEPASTLPAFIARCCKRLLTGNYESPYTASADAYTLAMELLEHARRRGRGQREPAAVRRAEFFCEHHFQGPVGVAEMADAAGMSRYHFSRVFRQWRGVSPGVHLRQVRLRKSVELLEGTDLAVEEIARRCGFNDAAYFTNTFRKEIGMPPALYRRSLR